MCCARIFSDKNGILTCIPNKICHFRVTKGEKNVQCAENETNAIIHLTIRQKKCYNILCFV